MQANVYMSARAQSDAVVDSSSFHLPAEGTSLQSADFL